MSTQILPKEVWTRTQRKTLFAGVGSWTLDAFDFFVLVFCLTNMAKEFDITVITATLAITFTLAMRPIGALIFGPMAERFGRKPVLIVNIVTFAVISWPQPRPRTSAPSSPCGLSTELRWAVSGGLLRR